MCAGRLVKNVQKTRPLGKKKREEKRKVPARTRRPEAREWALEQTNFPLGQSDPDRLIFP